MLALAVAFGEPAMRLSAVILAATVSLPYGVYGGWYSSAKPRPQNSSGSQLLFWLRALLNLVEIRNVDAETALPSHFRISCNELVLVMIDRKSKWVGWV